VTAGRGAGDGIVPALPHTIPLLEWSVAGLALAGPAASGPFLIEGARAHVLGEQRGPVRAISIDGVTTVSTLDTALGTAANIVVSPGLVRREFVGTHGVCVETIVVPPALPCVVLQWGTAGGTVPDRILIDLAIGGLAPRLDEDADGLALTFPDGRVVALSSSPQPLSIEAPDPVGDTIRVSIRPPDAGPFHLIIAAGHSAAIRSAFAATAHLSAHARRAASGPCEEGLTLHTGVTELDDGIDWARARLRGIIDRASNVMMADPGAATHGAHEPSALATGLAAISVGDRHGARQALKAHPCDGTPAGALLAARFASSFGDGSPALEHAHAMLATATPEASRPDDAPPATSPLAGAAFHPSTLRPLALRALADGLRHTAPETLIAQLRQAAASAADQSEQPPGVTRARLPNGVAGGTRLPVVGSPPDPVSWSAWLPTLLAGEPSMPAPRGGAETELLRRAGALFRTDPDAAWIEWRRALSDGLTGGPAGPGSWDPLGLDGPREQDSATAAMLLALTQGLLGLDPDAPVGRVRIAPRLPQHLTELEVRGITLGHATLRMAYRRSGATHLFTLEPEIASVPPLVVFEPSVYGRIREVRIDGLVADLNTRSVGALTIAPLQLPIDAPRSVELITESQ